MHRINNLRLARYKTLDEGYILVVDLIDVLRAEEALLVGGTHRFGLKLLYLQGVKLDHRITTENRHCDLDATLF